MENEYLLLDVQHWSLDYKGECTCSRLTIPGLIAEPSGVAPFWAEPVLLQRLTSSRQGKPKKESSVQRKAN